MNIPTHRILEDLSKPEAYPEPVDDIKILQTHISTVFLAGSKAYKVKKPVNFGFLDFTTLDKRRHYCQEEVKLNRRLSPTMYIDVIPITEHNGVLRFAGAGDPVEYAVLMKRLKEERLLSSLLERGAVSGEMVDRIAHRIASFHGSAATSGEITRIGGADAFRFNTEENFRQIESYVGEHLPRDALNLMIAYTRTFREVNEEYFKERDRGGWIRDGHGDLHAQHICMNEEILIYDCIEFNRRFRYADILCDASFLAMDVQMRGYDDLAHRYTNSYLSETGQQGTQALYNYYSCYHAVVRGKVECLRSRDPDIAGKERKGAIENARGYFDLAVRYAKTPCPPTLLITCGLTGSGKSSLARGLSKLLDVTVISTDRTRKELAGIDPVSRRHVSFRKDIYSEEFTERTYREIFVRARNILAGGRSALLDGTFADPALRLKALEIARNEGARFLILYLDAETEILRSRLGNRVHRTTVSDGREEILDDQMRYFVPPVKDQEKSVLVIDASATGEEMIRSAYRQALLINK